MESDNEAYVRARGVINQIFDIAVQKSASDIHLVVGKPPILRVQGELTPVEGAKALSNKTAEELVFSILSEPEREKFRADKELDVAHQTETGSRFRVNLHWEKGNASMAARTISGEIPNMEEIGLPIPAQEMVDLPHGLVLITGPTGSGKSTTLATMVERINSHKSVNIITLEDPIEFVFDMKQSIIRQRQRGRDFITFAEGLKHILRQDPNVVMVGEMRDMETIATTLTIAETGHLVFATLHTYSAAQTIDRIIDVFPAHQQNQIRTQLAMTLRGVVSQQLLPKKEGGRIAAREILVNNPAIANLIRENKIAQIKNVLQTSAAEGMNTLAQDLERLLEEDLIEPEVAEHYVVGGEKLLKEEEPKRKR
ncbi:hypothetical protein AMJ57_01270 [Parcubacteria bacterium SG8_24]|nr:MAG: hypothetical protein AMJ57_01270 [Parcubacteria bacterium SG8_24]